MPFDSPYEPIPIPETDIWNLCFSRRSKAFLDGKTVYTDGATGDRLDWGGLRSASIEFGKGLKALWGWRRGEVMAFFAPNGIDTPVVTMGLLWAGGVASPANPLYTADELAFQLRDSGARALVTQVQHLDVAVRAAAAAGIADDRIILVGAHMSDGAGGSRFKHYSSIRSTFYCSKYAQTLVEPRKDLAFLVYSSGTTGLPKGVCLSHYNMVANLMQVAQTEGHYLQPVGGLDGQGDRMLGVTPFFHVYGLLSCVLSSAYFGWELVIMSRFDMEQACALIEKHRITYIYVPPPIVLAFAKSPICDRYDLSSLKILHSGAAPLTRELTEELWNRLKLPVKQGYGLSETSPVVSVQAPDEWAKFMGSVGKLVPNMTAKLVAADGQEVPEGDEMAEGELWVKGPQLFLGYLNNPDKTRETMSEDGYFKTGDVFRKDRFGNLYCVDRLKELIKYKGFQVAPAELEGLLLGHPEVADVGVVGVQDDELASEVPRAYVVLKDQRAGGEAKAREIVDWMASRVAPHKKLRGGVVLVDAIPKSPSGKILRRVLRDVAKKERRGAKL
ncbi:hypothetical protein MCOR10_001992 [Pyricularia oryzae]|nr:hypothetical protein MCOR10_001992 [Pyricularia oryzae]KAI6546099.1 hypothetical protein MCOR05_000919 [Pyricularia oryzae]